MKVKTKGRRFFALIAALLVAAALPLSARATSVVPMETKVQGRPTEHPLSLARGTTRAQYIQILYQTAGSPAVTHGPSFTDVAPEAEYWDALAWAEQHGIAMADLYGTFRPDEELTLGAALEFFCRALSVLGTSVQQISTGVLAAYTGKIQEEDWALTPRDLANYLDSLSIPQASPTPLISLSGPPLPSDDPIL